MSITRSQASELSRVAITTHQKPIPINVYHKEFTVQQGESLLNPFFFLVSKVSVYARGVFIHLYVRLTYI